MHGMDRKKLQQFASAGNCSDNDEESKGSGYKRCKVSLSTCDSFNACCTTGTRFIPFEN